MEEQQLYGPVARDTGSRDATLGDWEQHHRKEVTEAEAMIARIDGRNPAEDQWLAEVKKLRSTLEHHIEEEEGKIWPKIRQAWNSDRLEEAGRQMEEIVRAHQRAA